MSLRDQAIKILWNNHNVLDEIKVYTATPNGVLTADFPHQLCYDTVGNDWYIHNAETVDTTWIAFYTD